MFKRIINLCLLVLLCGCAGVTLIEDRKKFQSTTTVSQLNYSHNIPFVRVAVITPVDINQTCRGNPWKSVDVTPGFTGTVLSILTLGYLDPAQTTIQCASTTRPSHNN